jgi:hypothetical protein
MNRRRNFVECGIFRKVVYFLFALRAKRSHGFCNAIEMMEKRQQSNPPMGD